jgi:hypothetical protein
MQERPTVKYNKDEIGSVRIVEDFLPSPDRLALPEEKVKNGFRPQRSVRAHCS